MTMEVYNKLTEKQYLVIEISDNNSFYTHVRTYEQIMCLLCNFLVGCKTKAGCPIKTLFKVIIVGI